MNATELLEKMESKEKNAKNLLKAINGLYGLMETSDEACDFLMSMMSVAVASSESDSMWDLSERSNVLHLCRHLCNIMRAAEPFKSEEE
jgi:hypothetical protein